LIVAFRAVHAEWGAVFAHLEDLGCGRGWGAVWRARPPAPLTCDECGHPMRAKLSPAGLKFFAHAPGAPHCALGLESVAHHLLKLELASAARDAGGWAEMEARGPSGWRADVLARLDGRPAVALEAQLAAITPADIRSRTTRMAADAVGCCWFSDRARPPWLGLVPSVRLAPADQGAGLCVVEGVVKFSDEYWRPVSAPLGRFVAWLLAGQVVTHTRRSPARFAERQLEIVWTAPRYIEAEELHLQVEAQRQRARDLAARNAQLAREVKRDGIRQRNAVSRAAALAAAAAAEAQARTDPGAAAPQQAAAAQRGVPEAIELLASRYGVQADVGFSVGDTRYANGIPLVGPDGVPAAVFGPKPRRVRGEAYLLLAGMLLLFPGQSEQTYFTLTLNRTKYRPIDGYRTDFVEERLCACPQPDLVARLGNLVFPAAPAPQRQDAEGLYRVRCRRCDQQYSGSWQRGATASPTEA
jgi:hypothetical protein